MGSRRWIWIAAAAVLLVACSSKGNVVSRLNQKSEAEQTAPTGYPSGEIQRASVCYNGTLYLYTADGFDLPLGDGFEKIGTIAAVDNTEYPSEEFYASRLDPGQEVYGNREEPDRIYVKYNSGFGLFEKAEDGFGVSGGRSAGENTISCINDGSVDWTGIKNVYLYGDGCAVPPTCTIRDEETISRLVEQVQQAGEYQEVSRSEYLEGMNGIWVEFDNGVCISMYREENYGTVSKEKETTGKPPFYRFPQDFRETVQAMLESPADYNEMIGDECV